MISLRVRYGDKKRYSSEFGWAGGNFKEGFVIGHSEGD